MCGAARDCVDGGINCDKLYESLHMKRVYFLSLFILIAFSQTLHAQRGNPVTRPEAPMVFLNLDPVLQQLAASVDSSQLIASLQRLEAFRTRHSSTDSVTAAKNWLISKFQEYGYSDILQHNFTWSGRTLQNIVVTKTGIRYPSTYVLLIGHYDSISETPTTLAPGVNDNGSGIALILEVARLLAAKSFDYSVRFVCFSAEEQGLVGSRAYVQNVVVPENHSIKLVINVDEIGGYRGNTNTMVKVERDEDNSPSSNNEASARYTDTLAAITRTYSTLTTTITNAYGSDYMSFEDAGYVITGYYEGITTPHYHRSTDNFANVDPQYVYQITRGAIAGFAHFAGIQRAFLTILHIPQGDTQDSSRSIQLDAKLLTSATISQSEILFRTNINPVYSSVSMSQIGSVGDSLMYRGFIPKQPYGTTVSYFLKFTNGDTVLSTFPADTTSPVVFHVAGDSIPPSITHSVLSNKSYLDNPYEVRATITDQSSISLAWIEYKVNGGTLRLDTMEQVSGDMWRGFITGPFVPGDRIEYAVHARDGSFSGNQATLPETGWYSWRVLNSILLDFENTNGGFEGSGDWSWGLIGTTDIPAPPRGQRVWATNLAGNYSNNRNSILESPTFDLSNKAEGVLTFTHLYRIEPNNDGGNVWVSVDSGAFQLFMPQGGYPFATIAALGGPGYSGNSTGWVEAGFPLAAFTNHRVRFRFRFASDWLTNHRGWYVDEMRIDYLDSITVDVKPEAIPLQTSLGECYPNPFNPSTRIPFSIGATGGGVVNIKVFDMLGREVALLLNEWKPAGSYAVDWRPSGSSSGLYFIRMFVEQQDGGKNNRTLVATRKVVLIK